MGDRFPETPEEMAALDPRRGTDQHCNQRGLSDLGDFLIQELIKRKMMIETDHISRKAAARILALTKPLNYPVINSHGGWGGTEALRDRIAAQGGISASFGSTRGDWVDKLTRDGNRPRPAEFKVGPFGGAGFASDVNGIAQLAPTRAAPPTTRRSTHSPRLTVACASTNNAPVTGSLASTTGRGVATTALSRPD